MESDDGVREERVEKMEGWWRGLMNAFRYHHGWRGVSSEPNVTRLQHSVLTHTRGGTAGIWG